MKYPNANKPVTEGGQPNILCLPDRISKYLSQKESQGEFKVSTYEVRDIILKLALEWLHNEADKLSK